MDEAAVFAERVRGNGRGRVRRVLAVAAAEAEIATLRSERFEVVAGDRAALEGAVEHEFDGVWLGRRSDVDASALAASFRALHHGFVRAPLDPTDPCDRPRVELLLERADFGVVGESERGLVGWTALVTPRVGAGAVVFDAEGRILLTDRADGRGWCMPGGFADPHEAPQVTVVRETREETGLDVEVERLFGLYSVTTRSGGKIVACAFLCRVVGGEPVLTDETVGIGWFGERELPEPIFPAHRVRLVDAFAFRRGEMQGPFV